MSREYLRISIYDEFDHRKFSQEIEMHEGVESHEIQDIAEAVFTTFRTQTMLINALKILNNLLILDKKKDTG